MKTLTKKSPMHITAEVFDALKRLQETNVLQLRELLEADYSTEWAVNETSVKSVERKIKRKLELLAEMELVSITKVGKENIYKVINNFPVQSQADKLMEQLKDLFRHDETLFAKAQKPLAELANELKSPYYIRQNVEDISHKEKELAKIEIGISEKRFISLNYKGFEYIVKPLKIAEFEGIWYLLFYYDKDNSYRKYRIAEVGNVAVHNEHFTPSKEQQLEITKWHNVWHEPNKKPTRIKIWISKVIEKYFYQKNIFDINSFPKRVLPCSDGIEYEIYITHAYEIIPEILYWQPYIAILEEDGALNVIETFNTILKKSLKQHK